MADNRTHYSDELLEEKFMTITAELRALRDVPVALGRLQQSQQDLVRATRESREECRNGIAALAVKTGARFDALDSEAKADVKERRAKRLAFWSPIIGALAGGAVLLTLKVVGV